MGWAKASLDTRFGTIKSEWKFVGDEIVYDFEIPRTAVANIEGEQIELQSGTYTYRFARNK